MSVPARDARSSLTSGHTGGSPVEDESIAADSGPVSRDRASVESSGHDPAVGPDVVREPDEPRELQREGYFSRIGHAVFGRRSPGAEELSGPVPRSAVASASASRPSTCAASRSSHTAGTAITIFYQCSNLMCGPPFS